MMRIHAGLLLALLAMSPTPALAGDPTVVEPASFGQKLGDMYIDKMNEAAAKGAQATKDKQEADALAGRDSPKQSLGDKGRDAFGDLIRDQAKGISDYWNAFKPMSPGDKGLNADKPPAGPRVPSSCAGGGCSQCYAKAVGDLDHLRFALEKLRAIGTWTEAFTKKSIAFGDSVSGVHGVAGLGWQPERKKIEESYEAFGKAYDAKYEELIGDLEAALQGIGECEAKYFKTNDWYDRFGVMYYTFMADRYRR